MIIYNSIDALEMQRIHDNSFPLPDLSNRLYISKKSVVADNQVVAISLIRLTCEGVLLTDANLPMPTRARASALAIEALKKDAIKLGLTDCHVFVSDKKTQSFLEHLGFSVCKEPVAMNINF